MLLGLLFIGIGLGRFPAGMLAAMAAAGEILLTLTETIISPLNEKLLSVHQSLGDFFSRQIVNPLDGGPGNPHLLGALLLGVSFQVHQPDGFIFIHAEDDRRLCAAFG